MDQSTNGSPNRPMITGLSQMQLFVGGIVAGILVLCTIGFFVLLGMMLNGEGFGSGSNAWGSGNGAPSANVANNQQPSVPANITVAPVTKDDHVIGAKNAKVTIVEYSDFECPFCGNFYPTMKQIIENYGDQVRVVYRHFPLSFHPQAQPAAEASECAAEQGKFWEFHDGLFEGQTKLSASFYKELAQNLKLNMNKFNDCVSSGKYRQKVLDQAASGDAAGVQGTPHTILIGEDGQMVPVSGAMPYASVEASLKQLL